MAARRVKCLGVCHHLLLNLLQVHLRVVLNNNSFDHIMPTTPGLMPSV
jgi:hypothetical protein